MPQLYFSPDDPNNHARFFAAWDTAGMLVIELAKRGASKTDLLELRRTMIARYTDTKKIQEGVPGLIDIDQPAAEEAMQDVVDSIFDRVRFT